MNNGMLLRYVTTEIIWMIVYIFCHWKRRELILYETKRITKYLKIFKKTMIIVIKMTKYEKKNMSILIHFLLFIVFYLSYKFNKKLYWYSVLKFFIKYIINTLNIFFGHLFLFILGFCFYSIIRNQFSWIYIYIFLSVILFYYRFLMIFFSEWNTTSNNGSIFFFEYCLKIFLIQLILFLS